MKKPILEKSDSFLKLNKYIADMQEYALYLERQLTEGMREATSLANSLYEKHYANKPDAVGFELCDDVAGVITQIDNMVSQLVPVTEWISVDAPPKTTKSVLVRIDSTQGPSFIDIDHYVNGEFHFQALTKCNTVSGWQPLPDIKP